jgi:hypothetical protein
MLAGNEDFFGRQITFSHNCVWLHDIVAVLMTMDASDHIKEEASKISLAKCMKYHKEVKQLSMENQEFSRIFHEINQRFRYFVANYTTAVKNGADVAESEIIEAVEDPEQPTNISAVKLFEAIKKGVQYAGEQMVGSGVDIFEQMKAKSRKK